ncbi:MAG: fumarylacetoacetate hydrolase family protein [Gammaproteobacteria bacterium]|nr:fumarylacetoacetate hydrolase family protein [Gammaproteobacteria bacterium]
MRLVTFDDVHQPRLAVQKGDQLVVPSLMEGWPAGIDSMQALIDASAELLAELRRRIAEPPSNACRRLDLARLLAPIPRPRRNLVCLGWNYADHAQESAAASNRKYKLPEHPVVFTKAMTSVTGPYADIPFEPHISSQIDWEVELGVVIGKPGRGIAPEKALEHVFGYTIVNDISARDMQSRHKQFFLGKSLDASSPVGPCIVTADEIPDPQRLGLRSWVNGALKQESNTENHIFDVATTISIVSLGMRLEPGDIIATGTPSGVGFARKPPEFLGPDDVVECEVEGIGRLRNKIVTRGPTE